MGFCGGDDWEPEIAAAGTHIYVGIAYFDMLLERTPKPQPKEPRSWRKDEYPF